MSSLLERSHPDVLKNKLQFKKPLKCLEYGAKTHSSSYLKCGPLNEFDSLVELLLIKLCFIRVFIYNYFNSYSIKHLNLSSGMIPNMGFFMDLKIKL